MTIETKYNIGDEVWFFIQERYKRKPTEKVGFISDLSVSVRTFRNKKVDIDYTVPCGSNSHYIDEDKLFPTKEALLQSL